jgi:hypothetical protein
VDVGSVGFLAFAQILIHVMERLRRDRTDDLYGSGDGDRDCYWNGLGHVFLREVRIHFWDEARELVR